MTNPLCDDCTLNGDWVRGTGCTTDPLIVFVGEAPGYHEVKEGRPFVGMAGQVIRRVISHVGIPIDKVYFTNLCMCRPPENRDPSAEEIRCCFPRLEHEICKLSPKMVIA